MKSAYGCVYTKDNVSEVEKSVITVYVC